MKLSCKVRAVWWIARRSGPTRRAATGGAGPVGGTGSCAPGVAASSPRARAPARQSILRRPSRMVPSLLAGAPPGAGKALGSSSIGMPVGADHPLVLAAEVLHHVERIELADSRPELAAQLPLDPAEEIELIIVGLE